jgi:CheY-like chemotaxis protein
VSHTCPAKIDKWRACLDTIEETGYAFFPVPLTMNSKATDFPSLSQSRTILIAEDESDDVFLLRRGFAKLNNGIGLRDVSDGQEAISYLSGVGSYADRLANPFPDCLFLDLKLRRKNGFEVLDWLRANAQFRVVPALVFSSSNDPKDIEQAYSLGAHGYFMKPSNPQELVHLLGEICRYWDLALRPRHL